MKKPYLAFYDNASLITNKKTGPGLSILTDAVEDSDPDEFSMLNTFSIITKSIEDSDPDE